MPVSLVRRSFAIMFVALLVLSLAAPTVAFAEPTSTDKQAEAQEALASLNVMQDNLNKASDNYYTAVTELEQAQANMDAAQVRIDEATEQIVAIQEDLGTRIKSMYRSGNTTLLDLIFAATSFEDFATNWDILSRMNKDDADMVQQVKDLRAEIEDQKTEYAKQEKIAATKTEEAKKIKEEAEATTAAMQEVYNNLSAEAAALLQQERAAQEAAAAAQAAAVVQAAASQGGSGSGFTPTYNAVTGNAIVDRAYSCIGAPYVWGASGPNAFDCSGLVGYALTGSTGRVGNTYTYLGWTHVSDPQPGDVAVNEGHCGIYIGGGQMVHAPYEGAPVCVGPVQSGMVFVRY